MSITAFPVLARILTERGLYKTRARNGDAHVRSRRRRHRMVPARRRRRRRTGARRGKRAHHHRPFGRLHRLHDRCRPPALGSPGPLPRGAGSTRWTGCCLLFAGVLLSALATDRIGIHAIFGAFLFGAIMPQRSEFIGELVGKLEDFAVVFLLPLFFAYTGLRTQHRPDRQRPAVVAVLRRSSCSSPSLGKWGGSTAPPGSWAWSGDESLALGVLMNTRGLTELIILNIGLDLECHPARRCSPCS